MARRGAEQTSRVARLARDLMKARWRGLENLDVHTSKQPPRDVPQLAQEAHAYATVRGVAFGEDRVAEIRFFLVEGLPAHAAKGYHVDAGHFTHLYFKPSASLTPRAVMKKWKADRERADPTFDYVNWRRIAYPRLAATLIELVDTATQEAAAARRTDVVTVTPIPEPPPRPRLGCGRAALAGFVGLLIAVIVLARLLTGTAAPPHGAAASTAAQATTINGYVECWPDAAKAVEGIWVKATSGGSGWAQRQTLPEHPNVDWFSYTLPYGGSYIVDVGCGGSPQNWEYALHSVTAVLGGGYYFTCYDTSAVRSPLQDQCRL